MTNMTPESVLVDRYAVVTEARTWLGTPFHHQARLKGVGWIVWAWSSVWRARPGGG